MTELELAKVKMNNLNSIKNAQDMLIADKVIVLLEDVGDKSYSEVQLFQSLELIHHCLVASSHSTMC